MPHNTSELRQTVFCVIMATNGTVSDKSIPELAKQKLEELFSMPCRDQWCTVVPKDKDGLVCTPSDSNKYYSLSGGCKENVKDHLRKSFKKIFTDRGHVETFWEDFTLTVTHKLGLTYREVQKMSGSLSSYSEAKLQQCIINPILKEVSKAASIIPDIKDETIKTDFLIEDEIEIQEGKRGQKPSVDAVIQVSNKDNKVIAFVPIEIKLDIDTKHYSQIACYMNKLSTAKDIRDCVMVGIIIDKKQFRLAFSVFKKDKVPLPIVHISPPIEWRSESIGSIVDESMLILTCTFLIGQLERIEIDSDSEILKSHPNVMELGAILLKKPHTLREPKREMLSLPLKRKLEEQQKQIDELKQILEERLPKKPKKN